MSKYLDIFLFHINSIEMDFHTNPFCFAILEAKQNDLRSDFLKQHQNITGKKWFASDVELEVENVKE